MVLSEPTSRTKSNVAKVQERVVQTAWLTARAPQELVDRVSQLAAAEDRSDSSVIRIAVREYLERNEEEAA